MNVVGTAHRKIFTNLLLLLVSWQLTAALCLLTCSQGLFKSSVAIKIWNVKVVVLGITKHMMHFCPQYNLTGVTLCPLIYWKTLHYLAHGLIHTKLWWLWLPVDIFHCLIRPLIITPGMCDVALSSLVHIHNVSQPLKTRNLIFCF